MHTNIHHIYITSRSVLLRMRNVRDETVKKTQNTHIMLSEFFFENPAFCEIIWDLSFSRINVSFK